MALDLSTLKVDKTIDARATACPGPLLDAKRAIAAVPVGGVLEVMSSDEGTKRTSRSGRRRWGTTPSAISRRPATGVCS